MASQARVGKGLEEDGLVGGGGMVIGQLHMPMNQPPNSFTSTSTDAFAVGYLLHFGVGLNISLDEFTTLPGVLFTCSTLITLKLDIGFLSDVPKGVIFSNLKTLHLRSVVFFSDDSVESLISSCTSLEDMVIEKCHMWNIINFNISHHLLRRLTILYSECVSFDFWLMIDAPNLAYFKYIDHVVARYSLENLQTLVKADLVYSITLLLSCEPLPVFATMMELKLGELWSSFKWLHWETRLETLPSSSPELEQLDFDQKFLSSLPDKGNILSHRMNGGKPSTD
ncbi:hypothetical protein PVK06_000868 [Gossypium arboreum]|uniref:F-box/LRR-repeat protein 15/At3g58940/PEG3-like LRR domain-containing protein n=1 Tax=Gossypium arboreum TaxID=29729 RepID=A0ABR0R0P5_GOSAR|nr:hypothetical protein PVK06_000868 [Gossypium arboreum]